jgi:hypothetical protein
MEKPYLLLIKVMVVVEQQVYNNLKGTRKTTQIHNVYIY